MFILSIVYGISTKGNNCIDDGSIIRFLFFEVIILINSIVRNFTINFLLKHKYYYAFDASNSLFENALISDDEIIIFIIVLYNIIELVLC
jgi:hypothetical protein